MPAFSARLVAGHRRSSLEIAEEQKSLSFSAQPARILFPNLKKTFMVSFSYVRKICYLGVLLVQIALH